MDMSAWFIVKVSLFTNACVCCPTQMRQMFSIVRRRGLTLNLPTSGLPDDIASAANFRLHTWLSDPLPKPLEPSNDPALPRSGTVRAAGRTRTTLHFAVMGGSEACASLALAAAPIMLLQKVRYWPL